MRPTLRIAVCAAVLLVTGHAGVTLAATPSGTAIAVIQATNVIGAGGEYVLQPAAPIYMGDRVNTGSVGEAQLEFRDKTKLVVGPGSSLLIDKFVFKDDQTAQAFTINAVKGSFRFISGNSPKDAYVIKTPTATLGLRGTKFDVSIGTYGETRIALYGGGGGIRACDQNNRNCVDLTGQCDVVVKRRGEAFQRIETDYKKVAVLNADFPYIRSESSLEPPFRIRTGGCNAAAAAAGPAGAGKVNPAPPAPDPGHDCGDWGSYKGAKHSFDFGRFGKSGKGEGKFGGNFGKGFSKGGPFGKGDSKGGRFGNDGPSGKSFSKGGKGGDGAGGRGLGTNGIGPSGKGNNGPAGFSSNSTGTGGDGDGPGGNNGPGPGGNNGPAGFSANNTGPGGDGNGPGGNNGRGGDNGPGGGGFTAGGGGGDANGGAPGGNFGRHSSRGN